jgi:acetyl-CoA carboxylase carboxyl transferase subunit beta
MRLAARLGLPLVTLIDTPGAELSVEAEAAGLAETISGCLAELSVLPVPTVSVVIGEGGSGGALALGLTDRALMQANAIYSVIAPEGAAAILYHDQGSTDERIRDVARALKLTAADCLRLGVIDAVVPEPPGGAQDDPDLATRLLGTALLATLHEVTRQSTPRLVADRYAKYRRLGRYDKRLHKLVTDRLEPVREQVSSAIGRVFGVVRARGQVGNPEQTGRSAVTRQMPDGG